jgi:F-type H+-transporting ATPase subunit epsilon
VKRYFVREGFAEVNPEGLTVLAETAVPVEDVDRAALDEAIKAAEKNVSDAKDDAARWKAVEAAEQMKAAAAQVGGAGATAH